MLQTIGIHMQRVCDLFQGEGDGGVGVAHVVYVVAAVEATVCFPVKSAAWGR